MINYLRNSVVSLSGISNQALHPSEMAALLVTDIHLEAGTIRIRGEPMKGEDITKYVKRSYKDLYPGSMERYRPEEVATLAASVQRYHPFG